MGHYADPHLNFIRVKNLGNFDMVVECSIATNGSCEWNKLI